MQDRAISTGLSRTDPGAFRAFGCVQSNLQRTGRLYNVFRLGHLVRRAVSQDEEFVRTAGLCFKPVS
jgi:hypothetical protein